METFVYYKNGGVVSFKNYRDTNAKLVSASYVSNAEKTNSKETLTACIYSDKDSETLKALIDAMSQQLELLIRRKNLLSKR